MSCAYHDGGSAELYFYHELDAEARERFEAHLTSCAICRGALVDLETIRAALDGRRASAVREAEDWDGFMQRLEARIDVETATRPAQTWRSGILLKIAATIAIAATGLVAGYQWQRQRLERGAPAVTPVSVATERLSTPGEPLTTVADRHLERSKLVLLGLSAKDPRQTRPGDWVYERELASSLLADTSQYRLTAADQGRADLVDVLDDLETVLLEVTLGDRDDPRALERVQRLISRRDLLTKIDVMNSEGPARRASGAGVAGRGHE
jgi:hypothetical protein